MKLGEVLKEGNLIFSEEYERARHELKEFPGFSNDFLEYVRSLGDLVQSLCSPRDAKDFREAEEYLSANRNAWRCDKDSELLYAHMMCLCKYWIIIKTLEQVKEAISKLQDDFEI